MEKKKHLKEIPKNNSVREVEKADKIKKKLKLNYLRTRREQMLSVNSVDRLFEQSLTSV